MVGLGNGLPISLAGGSELTMRMVIYLYLQEQQGCHVPWAVSCPRRKLYAINSDIIFCA